MNFTIPIVRLRQIRTPAQRDTAARVAECVERLRVALRQVAADQEHAHIPFISFREWLAGEGYERLIHPAWVELLTLVYPMQARTQFRRLCYEVLRERSLVTACDSCKREVPLAVCEIDHDECVTCPGCAAVELDARLSAGKVAA